MRYLQLIFVALCGVLPITGYAQPGDLCDDARLKRDPSIWCGTERVVYRENGKDVEVPLARVGSRKFKDAKGRIAAIGMRGDSHRYFLRTPNGDVFALNHFLQWDEGHAAAAMGKQQLEIGPFGNRRWFDKSIVRVSSDFCAAYRMKPPFTGELIFCDIDKELQGTVGLVAGAITAAEARRIVCDRVTAETKFACPSKDARFGYWVFRVDGAGVPHYRLHLERATCTPAQLAKLGLAARYSIPQPEVEFVYRVDLMGGRLTPMEKSADISCEEVK